MDYNLILDRLPNRSPNNFEIRTDFRESIKFELLMQDRRIDEEKKIILAINLYFRNPHIKNSEDLKRLANDIIWFYSCGKTQENNNKQVSNNRKKQIYSYKFDAEYIYAAFMEQYRIDLNRQYLHWWKFKALFSSLNEDILFSKIMKYRATDLSKIKDKETKNFYKKMKKIYALPDMRTQEEKESDFACAFL